MWVLWASTFHKQCNGRGGSWLKSVDLSLQLELPSTCASPHKIVQPCFTGIHHTPWVLECDIHLDEGSLSHNIAKTKDIHGVQIWNAQCHFMAYHWSNFSTFNTWLLGSKEHWFHHNLMSWGPKVKNVNAIGIYIPQAMPWKRGKLVEVGGPILAAWTALHMCVTAQNRTAVLCGNPPYSMGFKVRHPPWWGITLL
jgi:hypothetical protein